MNYVALIRGIGPGKPNMSNAELCRVIADLGFQNVQAVISSGNVIFTAAHADDGWLAKEITKSLNSELGIPGQTIVRSQSELEEILALKPFGEQKHSREHTQNVTFFMEPGIKPTIDHDNITIVRQTERELCTVSDHTDGFGPEMMRILEKAYGKNITSRTSLTIERIVKKMKEISS